ncbi:MAG: hypothetical protein HY335_05720 [Deinococcus sp.]|nr:hypothetical protein [Deinococcus sp.]
MRKTILFLGLTLLTATAVSALADVTTPTPFVIDARFGVPGQAYGGTRRVLAFQADPRTCNPFVAEESTSRDIIAFFLEALTARNNVTFEIVPLLAESIEKIDDLTFVYHLRRGLVWSDGTQFNADDVILSYLIHSDPQYDSFEKDGFDIDGAPIIYEKFPTADDPEGLYTIVQRLPVPVASPEETASFTIVPRSVFGPLVAQGSEAVRSVWTVADCTDVLFGGQLVGIGAYLMKEIRPGESYTLARNPNSFYVDADGNQLPYLDQITVTITADQSANLAGFLAGEADTFGPRNADEVAQVQDAIDQGRLDGAVYPAATTTQTSQFVIFNFNRFDYLGELFRTTLFRRAMSHLTDRETMVETCLGGLGQAAFGPITPALTTFYNPDVPRFEFNPEEANRLLDMIGLSQRGPNGFRMNAQGQEIGFVVSPNSGNLVRECTSQIFAEDVTNEGHLNVSSVPINFNTLVEQLTGVADDGSRSFDAIVIGLGGGSTITPISTNVYRVDGGLHAWNQNREDLNGGLPQPQVFAWELQLDDIQSRQDQEQDLARRVELVRQAQVIFAEQMPFVPFVWSALNFARLNTIANTQDLLPDPINFFSGLLGAYGGYQIALVNP